MPDLSVDNIVEIARALAKVAPQGMAATICLPAADTKPQQEQGRIHGNPVADGCAGAVMQKPLAILEIFVTDGRTNRPTDRPTDQPTQ